MHRKNESFEGITAARKQKMLYIFVICMVLHIFGNCLCALCLLFPMYVRSYTKAFGYKLASIFPNMYEGVLGFRHVEDRSDI